MNATDSGIVRIHNKEYQTVALRVKLFREKHPSYTLRTVILERDESCVVMEAQIIDEQGRLIANGHAEEFRSSSSINKTSALENSETSAIGRALAAFGLGGTEFATADEVANAITKKQEAKPNLLDSVYTKAARGGLKSLQAHHKSVPHDAAKAEYWAVNGDRLKKMAADFDAELAGAM